MNGAVLGDAFRLDALLGEGGMGRVWRAEHLPTGTPVAVKTLSAEPGQDWGAQFRHEVQAVARLEHPAVVAVLDAGFGDQPWMAMELVTGGTLKSAPPRTWEGVDAVVRVLLDGLAFAHARGVVHRDLKPSNVLLGAPGDARPGWKLADFGIAQLAYEGRDARAQTGTPGFMAPEQLRGDWRDVGPATDLYALGCLVWVLVAGRAPFVGELAEVAYGHLSLPPPSLQPIVPVPDGLEAWLRRCLEKLSVARFERAAEARIAWEALGEAAGVGGHPTATDEATRTVGTLGTVDVAPVRRAPVRTQGVAGRPEVVLPARPPEAPASTGVDLRGAGLGLYDLRIARLVGRDELCDGLWRTAVESASDGRTRLVVLRGASGAGKSALAEWLVERVHEAGGVGLRALHGPSGTDAGLAGMLLDAVGGGGLSPVELAHRLVAWGTPRGVDREALGELLEWLVPSGEGAGPLPAVRLGPDRSQQVVDRAVGWVAGGRPAVVWLDDLQWGSEALGWVEGALGGEGPLVVATVQLEALAERPEIGARLDGLVGRTEVEVVDVGPLRPERWPVLVRGLLGLSGALARRVEERTAGNPMFARQLVGDWVGRGLLEVHEDGWRLVDGVSLELPRDLSAVWEERIARLFDGVPEEGRTALRLGAALGVDVDREAWEAACAQAGVSPSTAPLDAAVRAALVRSGRDGWAFVHGMLREALLAVDPEARRELHRHCAEGLGAIDHNWERAEAIARHRVAAGELEAALRPMWQGALHRQRKTDLAGASALLDERDALLAGLDLPEDHPAWPEGWVQRSRIASSSADGLSTLDQIERAVAWSRKHGWNRFILSAAVHAVGDLAVSGRIDEARAQAAELEPLVTDATDRAMLGLGFATIALYERNYPEALRIIDASWQYARTHQATLELLRIRISAWAFQGQVEPATATYRELLEVTQGVPGSELANAQEAMGVLHHVRGEWEPAIDYYQRAIDYYASRTDRPPGTLLNLCLVRAHRGELGPLREALDHVRAGTDARALARWAFIEAIELRYAARQDQAALDASVARLSALLDRCALVDTDIEGLARLAAADAEASGLDGGAALEIAEAQRVALG